MFRLVIATALALSLPSHADAWQDGITGMNWADGYGTLGYSNTDSFRVGYGFGFYGSTGGPWGYSDPCFYCDYPPYEVYYVPRVPMRRVRPTVPIWR